MLFLKKPSHYIISSLATNIAEAALTTVELKLDDQTLERIRRAADPQNATLEVFIQDLIRRLFAAELATTDPFLGMFSQEPDL